MDAEVDPKFGRSQYFLIVDPDNMNFEVIDNQNIDIAQGSGIQTAQLISDKKVLTVFTGNCRPNARRVLEASGIKVVTGVSGKVRNVLTNYIPKAK